MTVHAAHSQEAVLQTAERQIVFELALHMRRQRPLTRRQVFYESWVVLLNELIQERLVGTVTGILARTRSPSDGVLAIPYEPIF
ncbi:MAG: hypothetical protein HYX63_20820 [Gammaproteobacteria bacterium]|nr:hypothetical protein [Gammaproteobacteria bacterium]